MFQEIINSPAFGVSLTVLVYWVFVKLYTFKTWPIFSPLLVAPLVMILLLLAFKIPFSAYEKGGDIITFLIGPSTVALAVPLYRHLPNLRKNLGPIMVAIVVGSLTGIVSGVLIASLLGADSHVALSLAAKSTTSPIALGITEKLGGNTALVIFSVLITGMIGGSLGPEFLRVIGIKDKIAIGISMGTSAHVGGTSRAVQLGAVEGSMSGAAIALTGTVTALIAPFIVRFLL